MSKEVLIEPELFGCLDCNHTDCNIEIAQECLNNNYKFKKF